MNKIDGASVVPIGWVVSGFGIVMTATILGSFWVAAVNFRLGRIEARLGIPEYKVQGLPQAFSLPSADAEPLTKDDADE